MIQSIRRCKRQQATGEAKTDSCEGQSNLVAGAQIQNPWNVQDTKRLKKGKHRHEGMTEDNDQQSFENDSNTDSPAGCRTDSLNAHSSTLNKPAIQQSDKLRERIFRMSHQELVDAYADCIMKREIEQTENQSLFKKARKLRRRVVDLEGRLADQESVVREAQESAFALMASNISVAENDDKICSRLRIIRMQWKIFAKKWSSGVLADIQDEKYLWVREMVNAWVAPDEGQSQDGIWAIENNRKAPSILLNTVLAHFISTKIIRKPFIGAYNLKEEGSVSFDDGNIMNSLDQLYAIKMRENEPAAHQWRSQTVSFLNLQHPDPNPESSTSKQALDRRNKYYRKLAYAFERSDANLLYRECSAEEEIDRLNHLMDLFCSAGDLFSRLWSQKAYIRTIGSRFLLKEPFRIGLDYCEAHAAHKLEEDDESKDGMPIQMVVEPGIFAFGNEQGESYEVYKVWGKAVVWLSSGGDESKAPYHRTVSGGLASHGEEPDELA